MSLDFTNFPFVSFDDFQEVTIDATRWEDDFYSATLVLLRPSEDNPDQAEGMILDASLVGESLPVIKTKIDMLMSLGLFADLGVHAHGTLFDENGDDIGMICWTSGGKVGTHDEDDDEDDDAPTVTVTGANVTVH